jgi:hypothetical protein
MPAILGSIIHLVLLVTALFSILTARQFKTANQLVWVLVVIFVPVIGPILYFMIGKDS